jgi:uncharacterized protein (DUF934 family)
MPEQLIKHRQVAENPWLNVVLGVGEDPGALPIPAGPVLLPLALWLARRDELRARAAEVGVWLAPGDEPALLLDDLAVLPLIAVHFPKFADGRGYSTARLLRERYCFKGELRAIGDIGRDQLFYLARVGFDAFLIPEGRDAEDALAAFADFPEAYQGAVDQPLPLFRRRAA